LKSFIGRSEEKRYRKKGRFEKVVNITEENLLLEGQDLIKPVNPEQITEYTVHIHHTIDN